MAVEAFWVLLIAGGFFFCLKIVGEQDKARRRAESVGADVPDDVRNYPKSSWNRLAQSGDAAEGAQRRVDAQRGVGQAVGRGRWAIVFGPGKYIGQRDLTPMSITFCQLPYEMYSAR